MAGRWDKALGILDQVEAEKGAAALSTTMCNFAMIAVSVVLYPPPNIVFSPVRTFCGKPRWHFCGIIFEVRQGFPSLATNTSTQF